MTREPAVPPYDPETYWNTRAHQYAGDPIRAVCLDDADENRCIDRIQRHLLRAAVRRLKRRTTLAGRAVLDYGCGTGRWVTFLRQHGLVYAGVDVAEEMLALARRCEPDAAFQRIDGNRLPHPDRCFDVVWSIAVVHHNPYDVQEQIIAEMARVLRDDGAVILFEGLGPHNVCDTNYFPRPLQDWLELAARHGLSCTWRRGATYMLLRPLVSRTARWMSPARLESWRRLLTYIDAVVDPYLLSLLPRRYHTRAVMLFERTGTRPR